MVRKRWRSGSGLPLHGPSGVEWASKTGLVAEASSTNDPPTTAHDTTEYTPEVLYTPIDRGIMDRVLLHSFPTRQTVCSAIAGFLAPPQQRAFHALLAPKCAAATIFRALCANLPPSPCPAWAWGEIPGMAAGDAMAVAQHSANPSQAPPGHSFQLLTEVSFQVGPAAPAMPG
jgi:hypothetical protein